MLSFIYIHFVVAEKMFEEIVNDDDIGRGRRTPSLGFSSHGLKQNLVPEIQVLPCFYTNSPPTII